MHSKSLNMLHEDENYFAPCTPKLIEQIKSIISKTINGDHINAMDFYKFWQNINSKQELFDYLIKHIAKLNSNISYYTASLLLLSLNSKKLNETNLKNIKTIFSKIKDSDLNLFKDISIQDSSSVLMIGFLIIWFKNVNQNPIFPITSMLLYPKILQKNDPFLSFHQFSQESEFFGIILQYTLLFRTASEENLKKIYTSFLKNFKDKYFFHYQKVEALLLSELNIPFSNAAIYNYNLIKCSNINQILFLPYQFYKSFLNIEVYSTVNKYQSIYSLIDNIYYAKFKDENISPNPIFLSEMFEKLIFSCENSYNEFLNYDIGLEKLPEKDNSELWDFFKSNSIPRGSPPTSFTPLMYQFDPIELRNEVSISFSSIKINDVPLLSGSSQNAFDRLKQGPKSNLYAVVIGGAIEMMNVLIDYVNFLFGPIKNSIQRDLFILPILNNKSRFSNFLNENDSFIHVNCNEIIKSIHNIFPYVSNEAADLQLPVLEPDDLSSFPADFWRDFVSPFSIFYRFFSFYCGCSSYSTKFAVWIAFLKDKKNQKFAVPFIDSVILKQCSISGSISFNLTSLEEEDSIQIQSENYKFNSIQADIKIMNMCMPTENFFPCTPEDNALILDANNLLNDESLCDKMMISSLKIKSGLTEFFDLKIDSVDFNDIKSLKIERLKKDYEYVFLTIRHFLPLKNGFD